MRYILIFWALPVGGLVAWMVLASQDMSGGLFFLSRAMYDFVFQTYGNILGIDPETIPPLVVRALVVDTFLIFGILAFRRRREITAWWRARREITAPALPAAGPVHPAE